MFIVSVFLQGAFASFLFFAARWYLRSDAFHHRVAGYTLILWLVQTILRLANYTTAPPLTIVHTALTIFDMTSIPACAFVLFSLTRVRNLTLKRIALHEAPFIVSLLIYLVTQNQTVFYIAYAYGMLYGPAMFYITLRDVKQYEKQICMIYSDLEHRTLNWLLCVSWMFLTMHIIWTSFSFMHRPLTDIAFYGACIVLWHRINMHLVKHLEVRGEDVEAATNEEKTIEKPVSNKVPTIKEEPAPNDTFGFADELIRMMEEDKAYLNPSLTINDVAQSLGTNRTYLSRHINSQLKLNFFDFVNQYRIAMAEQMLLETNKSIDSIAAETGFNSTMNFRRVFARTHDCTPGQFRTQAARK